MDIILSILAISLVIGAIAYIVIKEGRNKGQYPNSSGSGGGSGSGASKPSKEKF